MDSEEEDEEPETPTSSGFEPSYERSERSELSEPSTSSGSKSESLTDRFKRYVRRILPQSMRSDSSSRHGRSHHTEMSSSQSGSPRTHHSSLESTPRSLMSMRDSQFSQQVDDGEREASSQRSDESGQYLDEHHHRLHSDGHGSEDSLDGEYEDKLARNYRELSDHHRSLSQDFAPRHSSSRRSSASGSARRPRSRTRRNSPKLSSRSKSRSKSRSLSRSRRSRSNSASRLSK